MPATRTSLWLERIALAFVLSIPPASAVSAQTPDVGERSLEDVLAPGMTAWITDAGGQEHKARILGISGNVLTAAAGQRIRRLRTTEIAQVRVRVSDSLLNGALIGAGAAVASGLALCRAMEPWENCRDDVGPMLKIGTIGAGIGMAVDALIRGRRTIYEAAHGPARLQAAPIVGRDGAGLQISVRF